MYDFALTSTFEHTHILVMKIKHNKIDTIFFITKISSLKCFDGPDVRIINKFTSFRKNNIKTFPFKKNRKVNLYLFLFQKIIISVLQIIVNICLKDIT